MVGLGTDIMKECWSGTQDHTYLTKMVGTVIDVFSAVVAGEAQATQALVVGVVVDAGGAILAWVELLAAEGNLALTVLT